MQIDRESEVNKMSEQRGAYAHGTLDMKNLIGHRINEKCPKCGSTLLGNKRGDKWCSNVICAHGSNAN